MRPDFTWINGFRSLNAVRVGDYSMASSEWHVDGGLYAQNPISWLVVRPSEVPNPAAAWLFGSAILGLAGVAKRIVGISLRESKNILIYQMDRMAIRMTSHLVRRCPTGAVVLTWGAFSLTITSTLVGGALSQALTDSPGHGLRTKVSRNIRSGLAANAPPEFGVAE